MKQNPLYQLVKLVPFVLIFACSLSMPDPAAVKLLYIFMAVAVCVVLNLYYTSVMAARATDVARQTQLWHRYIWATFLSGASWGLLALPAIPSVVNHLSSTLILVIILITVALTSMIIAPHWRTFQSFLTGFMLTMVPAMASVASETGYLPVLGSVGMGFALYGLGYSIRQQDRKATAMQLEKAALADELAIALAEAEYLAQRDSLTGLYNRRAFEEQASEVRVANAGEDLTLIILDLDRFKAINDTHGHALGDSVLQRTADVIRAVAGTSSFDTASEKGTLARWGGEEFVMLAAGLSPDEGVELANAMRERLLALGSTSWPDGLQISGSFGVALWHPDEGLHQCLARADEALYRAKKQGRNRTCMSVTMEERCEPRAGGAGAALT